MSEKPQQFASDNYSGVCPEVFSAINQANLNYAESYGNDVWTEKACTLIREKFECDCEVFFVYTGTAANALTLAQICTPFHSVIAADTAHIVTDECGAPGFFSGGSQIFTAPNILGKLPAEAVDYFVNKRSDLHYPKPRAVTITQSTECGTCYTVEEIKSIADRSHRHNLFLQMDGARFANALAAQNCTPADLSWRAGVDVMTFGGSKNGAMLGEALIFFRKDLAEDFSFRCKQSGQLGSKLRFISSQYLGLLQDDLYLANARHANNMAKKLAAGLQVLPGIKLLFPVEANAIFAEMPPALAEHLEQAGWHFYNFIGSGGIRLMTSWNTRPETVETFLSDCRQGIELLDLA